MESSLVTSSLNTKGSPDLVDYPPGKMHLCEGVQPSSFQVWQAPALCTFFFFWQWVVLSLLQTLHATETQNNDRARLGTASSQNWKPHESPVTGIHGSGGKEWGQFEQLDRGGWPTFGQLRGGTDLAAGRMSVHCSPEAQDMGQAGLRESLECVNTPKQSQRALLPEDLGTVCCHHFREFSWEMMGGTKVKNPPTVSV